MKIVIFHLEIFNILSGLHLVLIPVITSTLSECQAEVTKSGQVTKPFTLKAFV